MQKSSNCKLLKSFDDAYHALIAKIVKQSAKANVLAAYGQWYQARDACKQIIVNASQRGNLAEITAMDEAVKNAFDSLNGDWSDLMREYRKYQVSSRQAFSVLCPDDRTISGRLKEAVVLKPNLYGIGIDLKTLFGWE